MERLSGEPAAMWGPSIVGFGSYHYKYESGREGDACRIGFSPRAKELVLYGLGVARQPALMERLGKHKTGKGCLYIKRLSDVDEGVLEELATEALAHMNEKYPDERLISGAGAGRCAGQRRLPGGHVEILRIVMGFRNARNR